MVTWEERMAAHCRYRFAPSFRRIGIHGNNDAPNVKTYRWPQDENRSFSVPQCVPYTYPKP
jgi:hypothetical protein